MTLDRSTDSTSTGIADYMQEGVMCILYFYNFCFLRKTTAMLLVEIEEWEEIEVCEEGII